MFKLFIIAVFFCANVIADSELPSFIQKCRRYQPEFEKCALQAEKDVIKYLINGYPEKGIAPIEPITSDLIVIKGKPNRQFILDQTYRNIKIHGFSDVIIKNLTGNVDECIFHEKLLMPRIEIHSDYEMNGKLLLLTVVGSGKANITCTGVAAQVTLKCEYYKENNNEYMRFTDFKFKIKAKHVHLDMKNLVKDNKELSQVLENVLNENALELFNEYSEPYAKAISVQLLASAQKLIGDIPVSKLVLPD